MFKNDEDECEKGVAYHVGVTLFTTELDFVQAAGYVADPRRLSAGETLEDKAQRTVNAVRSSFFSALNTTYRSHQGRKAWHMIPGKPDEMPRDYKAVLGHPSSIRIVEEMFATMNRLSEFQQSKPPRTADEVPAFLQSAQEIVKAFEKVFEQERATLESLPPLPKIARPSLARCSAKTGKGIITVKGLERSRTHR